MKQTLDIIEWRSRLKLSQADFALLVGVNQATVSKWETGSIAVSRLAHQSLERLQREVTTRRMALKVLRRLKQEEAA